MNKHQHTNFLINEKSPYLQQHAHNPVNWYPWGKAAFEAAKKNDKPIFLSIGYATCHWCHVMERESFENEQVAKLMNDAFISIKVDREEYPAVDNLYMQVCMLLTGSGGWPLNIILTPDKKPFYAATYIPRESRFGRPGMLELIPQIRQAWQTRRKELEQTADRIVAAMKQEDASPAVGPVNVNAFVEQAAQGILASFDKLDGGFGTKPKFPVPQRLMFLLHYWYQTGNREALQAVETTLLKMRQGGIYDQIGFGFHRYSTDVEWLVPHFEKMLYDQALLAIVYIEMYQATGQQPYRTIAEEILTYVLRDMTDKDGGFYTAEDADSEGEEGKFYVWNSDELKKILSPRELMFTEKVFDVSDAGNYHDEATQRKTGLNILHLKKPLHTVAGELGVAPHELSQTVERIRQKLFKVREQRIHPLKDRKILTDWNGLMIAAFARAGRVFDSEPYRQAAVNAAEFIRQQMTTESGRLMHRYKDGHVAIPANLDDYAFMIWSLLELYDATFDAKYLARALQYEKVLDKHFSDRQRDGFFMTPDDGEKLILRPREFYGGAYPSGNAIMVNNLIKLSKLTGNSQFAAVADKTVQAIAGKLQRGATQFPMIMNALLATGNSAGEVVIAGDYDVPETVAFIRALNKNYLPDTVVILRPPDNEAPILKLAPYAKAQKMLDGKTTVYVCKNFACQQPVQTVEAMLKLLTIRKK
ncbi:MAG: thioredoxin domain-containing protein [Victivallaceae bacterium]|nr:thioredoxin domain-containing protein [Victivallaceae bacterium]